MDENSRPQDWKEAQELLQDMRDRWARAIGRVMLAFGEIEWAMHYALAELPRDRLIRSTLDLPFRKRLDILAEVLRGRPSDPMRDQVLSLLDVAKDLSEKRNLIAHNPQRMSLYADEHGTVVKIQEELSHHRNENRSMDYAEVLACAEQAERLERSLWSAISKLVKNRLDTVELSEEA